MSKPKVLFILHLPPPCHGAAEMGRLIRKSARVNEAFETRYINLSASRSIAEIGRFAWKKLNVISRLLRQVRKEIREWNPDLVYLTPSSTMPGLLKDVLVKRCAVRRGAKVVLHFHNRGVSARQDRFLDNLLYHKLFSDAHVILLSPRLYPDMQKYLPSDRVSFCANGIPAPAIPSGPSVIPSEAKESTSQVRFVFLSNLIRSKGIPELLDACQLLHASALDFTCDLIGKETEDYSSSSLAAEIESKGLLDRVHYLGPKYGPDKWAALSQADVFVFPSWYPAECFPLVLLEAMAAGLPIVTTDEGAIPDIVREGENGFVCPVHHPESVADALRKLLSDSELRKKMGECGYRRYQEGFTAEAFESHLIGILEKVLDA